MDHVGTQGEDSHPRAEEKGLGRDQPPHMFVLDSQLWDHEEVFV